MAGNNQPEAHTSRRGWLTLGAEAFCYDVSDSFAEMLGVPKSRFYVRNWIRLVYPDDREAVRMIANSLQRLELPRPVRFRWLRQDETPIWLEVRFLRRRHLKKPCGDDLIFADVRPVQEVA